MKQRMQNIEHCVTLSHHHTFVFWMFLVSLGHVFNIDSSHAQLSWKNYRAAFRISGLCLI